MNLGHRRVVMVVLGLGDKIFDDPVYLRSFDHEAYDGRGDAVFTNNKALAMVFESVEDAARFWNRVPSCKPLREDGRPNKPLTATTVTFEAL